MPISNYYVMKNQQAQDEFRNNPSIRIAFAVSLISVLGVSSVSPAFPKIIEELGISTESVGLLITVFTIPGIVLTLVFGVAADRFGRRHILIPSLFIFGIAGFLCSLVRNFSLLLLLRFIQGIGAAPLNALGITIIGDILTGEEQKKAIAYSSSGLSVGLAIYPTIGGLLATFGWYYPFAISIVAVPVGLAAIFWLDLLKPSNSVNLIDYVNRAGREIKCKKVIMLFSSTLVIFLIVYGAYQTYFPIFLAGKFNTESWVIGTIMSSMTFVTALVTSQLPRLMKTYSQISLLMSSYFFYAIGILTIPFSMSLWFVLIPSIIFGIGHGISFTTIQSLLSEYSSIVNRAAILSLNGTIVRIGQTLGPLIAGLVFMAGGIIAPFILCSCIGFANICIIFLLGKDDTVSEDSLVFEEDQCKP